MTDTLWQPDHTKARETQLYRFQEYVGQHALFPDYRAFHRWSVTHPEAFWHAIWQFCGIQGQIKSDPSTAVTPDTVCLRSPVFRHTQWFPQARLNFAENMLHLAHHPHYADKAALVAIDEAGVRTELSYRALYHQAGAFAAKLLEAGIKPGDRVAAYMPNRIETVVAALGTSWIGAIWSACSPDFGEAGLLDRFGQIEPNVLLATDGYQYNGKWIDLTERVNNIARQLGCNTVIHVPGREAHPAAFSVPAEPWSAWCATRLPVPDFARLPFNHPLYILYSSGTTGKPKCIVHGAGGTLLQHAKEHRLHVNVRADDVFFYFTTCGWMMWNWLVSGLHTGCTLVLYDGNPAFPESTRLFDLIDQERISIFGTSAKFISAVEKSDAKPADSHALTSLHTLLSTGSPLLHESYDFIYQHIKSDLLVSSISGGTDIVSCFALGNPTLPVIRGELQCFGLGMDVRVFNEHGQPVDNTHGELVCANPFPSCPVGFWNDPDEQRFQKAYFERFATCSPFTSGDNHDVWAHGDFAETVQHAHHDGLIIHGRSDAVLNPGGVRIGTAEIYRQVETLPEIRESIVIGQQWDGDVRVVLFVVLQPGETLTEALCQRIRHTIRSGASPRHVPAKILAVQDIPRTVSGKIVELAVRDVVHGRTPSNAGALANPEALAYFHDRSELMQP